MRGKHIKDVVIALIVVSIIIFLIKDYHLYSQAKKIRKQSKYKDIALSEKLLDQINDIEKSIQSRKNFVFTVQKDPLEQNLIVKTQKDLVEEWRKKVRNMVRLEFTVIPENGEKVASIDYQGKSKTYTIGDTFELGKIVDIDYGKVVFTKNGVREVIKTQKIPPKPEEIKQKNNKSRQLNW